MMEGPKDVVRDVKRQVWGESQQNSLIGVHGLTGSGKSGFVMMFAKEIQPTFDPERQVVYSAEEGIELSQELGQGEVIVFDEAITAGGNKRRAMSGDNVAMQVFVNTCRKRRQVVVFITPMPDELDNAIVKHLHWIFDMKKPPGHGRVVKVELVGVKFKKVWWNMRAPFTFPECEKADPELWGSYQKRVWRYLNGVDDGSKNLIIGQAVRAIRALRTDPNCPLLFPS